MSTCVLKSILNDTCLTQLQPWHVAYGVNICESCMKRITNGGDLKYQAIDIRYKWPNFKKVNEGHPTYDKYVEEKERRLQIVEDEMVRRMMGQLTNNGWQWTRCDNTKSWFRGPPLPICLRGKGPELQVRRNMQGEALRYHTQLYDKPLSGFEPMTSTNPKGEQNKNTEQVIRLVNCARHSIENYERVLDNICPMYTYINDRLDYGALKAFITEKITPLVEKTKNRCGTNMDATMFRHQLYLKYICDPFSMWIDERDGSKVPKPHVPRLLIRYTTGSGKTDSMLTMLSNFLMHPTLVLVPDDAQRTQLFRNMYGLDQGNSVGVWPIRKLTQIVVDFKATNKKTSIEQIMLTLPEKTNNVTSIHKTIIPDLVKSGSRSDELKRCSDDLDELYDYVTRRAPHQSYTKFGPLILTFEEFNIILRQASLEDLSCVHHITYKSNKGRRIDLSQCAVFIDEVHELTDDTVIEAVCGAKWLFAFSATVMGPNSTPTEKTVMGKLMNVTRVDDIWSRTVYFGGNEDLFKKRCYTTQLISDYNYLEDIWDLSFYDKTMTKQFWEGECYGTFDTILSKVVDESKTVRQNFEDNLSRLAPVVHIIFQKIEELLKDSGKTVVVILSGKYLDFLSTYLTKKHAHTRLFMRENKITDDLPGLVLPDMNTSILTDIIPPTDDSNRSNNTMIKVKAAWNEDPAKFINKGVRLALYDATLTSGHDMKHYSDVIIGHVTGNSQMFAQLLGRFDRSCETNTTVKYHFITDNPRVLDHIKTYNQHIEAEKYIAQQCLLNLGTMSSLSEGHNTCPASKRNQYTGDLFPRYRLVGEYNQVHSNLDLPFCAITMIILMAIDSKVIETNTQTLDRIVDHIYNINPVGCVRYAALINELLQKMSQCANLTNAIDTILSSTHISPQLQKHITTARKKLKKLTPEYIPPADQDKLFPFYFMVKKDYSIHVLENNIVNIMYGRSDTTTFKVKNTTYYQSNYDKKNLTEYLFIFPQRYK